MTTIVATKDAIYADSLLTIGDESMNCTKVFSGKGCIYASAGDSRLTNIFDEAMKAGKPIGPEVVGEDESFQGVVINKDGLFYYDKNFSKYQINDPFIAIGSGSYVAKSWLLSGASPIEAICKAAQVHNDTGGPVQKIVFKPTRRKNAS